MSKVGRYDMTPTHSTRVLDGETALLLGDIQHALRLLDQTSSAQDTHCFHRALDTYFGVKDLLPKLALDPEQLAAVRERLEVLHKRLGGAESIAAV